MMSRTNRRAFVLFVAGGAALAASGAANGAETCPSLKSLPAGDRAIRNALNFQDESPDPKRACLGCAFFTTRAVGAACGTCAMFSGGPVNATSVCDSWTARS